MDIAFSIILTTIAEVSHIKYSFDYWVYITLFWHKLLQLLLNIKIVYFILCGHKRPINILYYFGDTIMFLNTVKKRCLYSSRTIYRPLIVFENEHGWVSLIRMKIKSDFSEFRWSISF